MQSVLPKESFTLAAGILFGETEYMDEELYGQFRNSGAAHILAVSGLHVNLAYSAVTLLLKGRRSKCSDLFSLLFVGLYCALANYSVSVLRAAFMLVLRIAAFHLNRRYDIVTAASLAAIILLLNNPYMLFDSGLQLSFAAAYSMGIILPWLETRSAKAADRIKSELGYRAAGVFLPGLAAIIGTTPLISYHFLMFSPAGLLLNPLILAIAGIALPLGLAVFSLFLILPRMLLPLPMYVGLKAVDMFFGLIEKLTAFSDALLPGVDKAAPPLGLIILYYVFVFFFFSEARVVLHRKKRYAALFAAECMLFLTSAVVPWGLGYTNTPIPWDYGTAAATFLDVGQGDCIHIHAGRKNILIDGGGNYYSNIAEKTLKPYLLKNGIDHIDLAIVTHLDQDHSKGIYQLAEIFPVDKIITNKDIYGDTGLDENDCCIVSAIELDGTRLLLMSDAGTDRELALIEAGANLDCDIIKIGHHGSRYSTGAELISAASPSFAVISVGKNNNYGHPSDRVIELLGNSGIIYGRTDESGALCLRRSGKDYFLIENAAKDRRWLIPKQQRRSTPSGP